MKTIKIVVVLFLFLSVGNADAQIWKKIAKKGEKRAEQAVVDKAEEKATQGVDNILNGGKRQKVKDSVSDKPLTEIDSGRRGFSIFTKFDFVSGEEILFYDDFSSVSLGDFPENWDTNGTGESVDFNGDKWFGLANKSTYIPILPENLPEEFTVEFDMYAVNNTNNGSQARCWFWLADNNTFNQSKDWAGFDLEFWDQLVNDLRIKNEIGGKSIINNVIQRDLRPDLKNPVRMSISVNKRRFRFWMNEKKVIDVPRLVPEVSMASFKMRLQGFTEYLLIDNFKIATGIPDLREQLINEGSFSTTGIYFDSGSSDINPESYGTLKNIAQTIKQDNFRIHIVGHTDNEGDTNTNMRLSKSRAENVKLVLISYFDVDASMLSSGGMGESEPIMENDTPQNKAKNRRVEFIKL